MAKIVVNPTAGTAISAPDRRPFTTACSKLDSTASGYPQQPDMARLYLLVAEFAVYDVADRSEVAGAAGAVVINGLLRGDSLQPIGDIAHREPARRLADVADSVADRRAARLARRRH